MRAASSSYSAAWVKSASRSLTETLGENGVSSNYRFELTPRTWEFIRDLRGGTAIFTMPAGPIKCAGAPQKIAYLAADWWRSQGVLDKTRIILVLPNTHRRRGGRKQAGVRKRAAGTAVRRSFASLRKGCCSIRLDKQAQLRS